MLRCSSLQCKRRRLRGQPRCTAGAPPAAPRTWAPPGSRQSAPPVAQAQAWVARLVAAARSGRGSGTKRAAAQADTVVGVGMATGPVPLAVSHREARRAGAAHRCRRLVHHALVHEASPHRRVLHQRVEHGQRGDSHAHEAAGDRLLALVERLHRSSRAAEGWRVPASGAPQGPQRGARTAGAQRAGRRAGWRQLWGRACRAHLLLLPLALRHLLPARRIRFADLQGVDVLQALHAGRRAGVGSRGGRLARASSMTVPRRTA